MTSTQIGLKKRTISDYVVMSGTLIVQLPINPNDDDTAIDNVAWLESAIDKTGILTRANGTTSRTHETIQELRTDIEHRPAYGASSVTLHLLLKQMLQTRPNVIASEVFHYTQREAAKAELVEELAALVAQAEDMTVPLPRRRELSDKADRLQETIGESHE